ncbi:MAG: FxsB family cyclophane-forming radical SAM/SPASM peptide maturase [Gammaproteobacteria bacterium]
MTDQSTEPDAPGQAGMRAGGPIRQLVLKIHSRCNLSCNHCYIYTGVDQSWRRRPITMAAETVFRVAERIAEHAQEHALSDFRVVLHGGEPLLAGAAVIDNVASAVRAMAPAHTRVQLAIQTNGVLLNDRFLELFHHHRIRVGVSLDGDRVANDRHRLSANGSSSYAAVARALAFLGQDCHRDLYAGLLCTIDLRNDPVTTYENLLEHAPPLLDLLLPHANWTAAPPGFNHRSGATPYGDWLIAVFERWYSAPRRETGIRLFDSLISLMLGGSSGTTAVGLGDGGLVTVETDGSIEASDALKTAAEGAAGTGMTVFAHSFDQAMAHPSISRPSAGLAGLCAICRSCPVVSICGGGLYAHRFREGNDFDNPSSYCADLYRLIEHIRVRIQTDLRALRQVPMEQ